MYKNKGSLNPEKEPQGKFLTKNHSEGHLPSFCCTANVD